MEGYGALEVWKLRSVGGSGSLPRTAGGGTGAGARGRRRRCGSNSSSRRRCRRSRYAGLSAASTPESSLTTAACVSQIMNDPAPEPKSYTGGRPTQ